MMQPITQMSLRKSHSLKIPQAVESKAKYKCITQGTQQTRINVVNSGNKTTKNSERTKRCNPYDSFVRQLKIKLPSPKQKFMQFLQLPPFRRGLKHFELINHFLKGYKFFKNHPSQILQLISQKIVIIPQPQINSHVLVVIEDGKCQYRKRQIKKGDLLFRKQFKKDLFVGHIQNVYIGLQWYQYNSVVSDYLKNNLEEYKQFLNSIQIFKIFTHQALKKIHSHLSLMYINKDQPLFYPGDQAYELYLIHSGVISRKVIVQIDKINKIPVQKFSKLVKIMSKSYEHKITFNSQDLIGISDLLQARTVRKELLTVQQDSLVIVIDRSAIQTIDQYMSDRLLQYNNKKYPTNYDDLCGNYMKTKMEAIKSQQRKIQALSGRLNENITKGRYRKIKSIISVYEGRIRALDRTNLLYGRKEERLVNDH